MWAQKGGNGPEWGWEAGWRGPGESDVSDEIWRVSRIDEAGGETSQGPGQHVSLLRGRGACLTQHRQVEVSQWGQGGECWGAREDKQKGCRPGRASESTKEPAGTCGLGVPWV